MILVNLLSTEKNITKDRSWPIALALLGLLVAGLFVRDFNVTSSATRPLYLEEKEILISALERVENVSPEFSGWAAELKTELEKSAVEIYVSSEGQFSDFQLVTPIQGGISVSPQFFKTDPIAQEASLLSFIAHKNIPIKRKDEIVLAE